MTLAPDQVARIESVSEESIAAKAGLQKGDEIISLKGQPLVSIADVSWVLHHSPDQGSLDARVKRGSAEKSMKINLPADWRFQSDISRRVGTWEMRAMASGGLLLEELSATNTRKRGWRKQNGLAGEARGRIRKTRGGEEKAGFQKGDILVSVDGISKRISESELIGRLLDKHQPGEKVPVTVLRGKDRVELSLPIQ